MKSVHAVLADYRCAIEELIAGDDAAATRMIFFGIHRGPLFGVATTGKPVSWTGAAFFTFALARIGSLRVLGDMDGLKRQLGAAAAPPF